MQPVVVRGFAELRDAGITRTGYELMGSCWKCFYYLLYNSTLYHHPNPFPTKPLAACFLMPAQAVHSELLMPKALEMSFKY